MQRIVFLLLIFLLPGLTSAQSGKKISLYLCGGAAISLGDLSDTTPYGFLGRTGFGFKPAPISSPELQLIADFQAGFFPAGHDNYGDIRFILAGLDARLNLYHTGANGFYVTIGGGYAYTQIKEHTVPILLGTAIHSERFIPEITEHNPYISPGLGYEFGKSQGLRFYIEGRVINVFGTKIKNYSFLPLFLGIKL